MKPPTIVEYGVEIPADLMIAPPDAEQLELEPGILEALRTRLSENVFRWLTDHVQRGAVGHQHPALAVLQNDGIGNFIEDGAQKGMFAIRVPLRSRSPGYPLEPAAHRHKAYQMRVALATCIFCAVASM